MHHAAQPWLTRVVPPSVPVWLGPWGRAAGGWSHLLPVPRPPHPAGYNHRLHGNTKIFYITDKGENFERDEKGYCFVYISTDSSFFIFKNNDFPLRVQHLKSVFYLLMMCFEKGQKNVFTYLYK
jgi:hypothetical protein